MTASDVLFWRDPPGGSFLYRNVMGYISGGGGLEMDMKFHWIHHEVVTDRLTHSSTLVPGEDDPVGLKQSGSPWTD